MVDDSAGAVAVCTPPSGATFLPGVTTVSCTARDGAGNVSAPCSFRVRVVDYSGDLAAFAPCWRGGAGATFQHWAFSMPDDPASLPAEKANNAFGISNAVIALGPFSSGYIDSDPFLGCHQGIWDLGTLGTITLTISNNPMPSATAYTYVQVQVTQYRDGIFQGNAAVSVPGGALVSKEEQEMEATRLEGTGLLKGVFGGSALPSPI